MKQRHIMTQWRYAIINLLRQAYQQGQLTLPTDLQAQCPSYPEFNAWLDRHYHKAWQVHLPKLF